MEHTKKQPTLLLKTPDFFLLGIAGSLIAIHLTLFWRYRDTVSFALCFLFVATVCSQIKEKRHTLNLDSGLIATLLGFLLIALIFISSTYQMNSGVLFSFSIFISSLGLALIASGFQGLKQYWQELLAMLFFSIRTLLPFITSTALSIITARFSTMILWYTGFNVSLAKDIISLPTGSVRVYEGCSGIGLMLDTLSLAVLFFFMFEISLKQKFFLSLSAVILGFVINSIRVALMAILVAQGDTKAFDYWHSGDGSMIFSMISSFIFCCLCWFILSKNQNKNQTITNS